MSTVKYRYENNLTRVVGGVKETIKESIIDGEKGVSFSFLKKVGDKSFYKIHVKEVEKDKFQMMEKHDDKVLKVKYQTELMKKKGNKDLAFVEKYLSKERAKYQKGGAKKSAKKSKNLLEKEVRNLLKKNKNLLKNQQKKAAKNLLKKEVKNLQKNKKEQKKIKNQLKK